MYVESEVNTHRGVAITMHQGVTIQGVTMHQGLGGNYAGGCTSPGRLSSSL